MRISHFCAYLLASASVAAGAFAEPWQIRPSNELWVDAIASPAARDDASNAVGLLSLSCMSKGDHKALKEPELRVIAYSNYKQAKRPRHITLHFEVDGKVTHVHATNHGNHDGNYYYESDANPQLIRSLASAKTLSITTQPGGYKTDIEMADAEKVLAELFTMCAEP